MNDQWKIWKREWRRERERDKDGGRHRQSDIEERKGVRRRDEESSEEG